MMTSREITDGIVQEFLAGALHQRREAGKRVFAEETLIAVGTQVNSLKARVVSYL